MMILSSDGTLVYELVESMLSIGSWLAPHYWPSVVGYTSSMVSDVLSIRLHVTLDNRHSLLCVNVNDLPIRNKTT